MEIDLLAKAVAWADAGRAVAFAVVLKTWGSAPRPAGSFLIVDDQGRFEGSVSGGCVETTLVVEALDAIETGVPRVVTFGVSDETAWRVGLSCGGTIEVFVCRLGQDQIPSIGELVSFARAREAAVHILDIETGEMAVAVDGSDYQVGLRAAIDATFAVGRAHYLEDGGKRYFVNPCLPSRRLVLVGAVHIAQSLAEMAAAVGYDVSIIDPRESFATEERFPAATVMQMWPDEALSGLKLDSSTALAVLTHDPKIDDNALAVGLGSQCFYIGALGSQKTHSSRIQRLRSSGAEELELAKVRGPIGLDIGARSPAEIAVAILAEIIASQPGAKAARAV